MTKKKWIVTIATALVLVTALGTTVAFAAEDDAEFGYGMGRRFNDGYAAPYSEEWLDQLVEDGLITQSQAESILAGDAHLYDYVDPEDCDEYGLFGRGAGFGYIYNEERFSDLVEEGSITQDQADSILSGDAQLSDFVDHDDCLVFSGEGYSERGLGNMSHGRGNR